MAFLDVDKTVFDEFYDLYPELTITEVRSALARFLFYGEDVFKKINVLSGGEKVRLKLCEILKKGANLLLLDEPTNHMDIVGKESLEEMLKKYKGTLLFVSHDRYFVNKVADSLLVFKEDGKVEFFNGTYDEYMSTVIAYEEVKTDNFVKEKNKNNEYFANKEKNKMKMRLNKVEKNIAEKENCIKEIQIEMTKETVFSDYVKLSELQAKLEELTNELDGLMLEWEELSCALD